MAMNVKVRRPTARATATSGTTIELIDARLSQLQGREDPESVSKRAFLTGARERLVKKQGAPPAA